MEQFQPSRSDPLPPSNTGVWAEELEPGVDSVVRGHRFEASDFVALASCVCFVRNGSHAGNLYERLSDYALCYPAFRCDMASANLCEPVVVARVAAGCVSDRAGIW